MTYSPEEKAKMDALVSVFSDYIDDHSYFDVVYSKKMGYLRIVDEEASDAVYMPITSADDLLRMIYDDMIQDEIELLDGGKGGECVDYGKIRRRIDGYLVNYKGDHNRCHQILETCIAFWRQQ